MAVTEWTKKFDTFLHQQLHIQVTLDHQLNYCLNILEINKFIVLQTEDMVYSALTLHAHFTQKHGNVHPSNVHHLNASFISANFAYHMKLHFLSE